MKSLLEERRLHLLAGLLALFAAPLAFAAPGAEGPTVAGIPVDFILFAATLLGVALFHHHVLPCAAGGAHRSGHHRHLQDSVYRFQGRRRRGRLRPAYGARVGTARQPALPAGRLRAAGQTFRGQRRAGSTAETAAGRLAGAFRAARHHIPDLGLSRQHRCGADRCHGRRQRLQAQGAYRLSGGHRRRLGPSSPPRMPGAPARWSATRRRR